MSDTKIEWKVKLYDADAEKCKQEIDALGSKYTVEDVVEKARDESTELHKCFEWDDSIAGEKYRIEQARRLIGNIHIRFVEVERPSIRVYMKTDAPRTYQETKLFLRNEDEYESLLKRAKSELDAFIKKYETLSELDSVFEEIKKIF